MLPIEGPTPACASGWCEQSSDFSSVSKPHRDSQAPEGLALRAESAISSDMKALLPWMLLLGLLSPPAQAGSGNVFEPAAFSYIKSMRIEVANQSPPACVPNTSAIRATLETELQSAAIELGSDNTDSPVLTLLIFGASPLDNRGRAADICFAYVALELISNVYKTTGMFYASTPDFAEYLRSRMEDLSREFVVDFKNAHRE
jgi:hypothetical protein